MKFFKNCSKLLVSPKFRPKWANFFYDPQCRKLFCFILRSFITKFVYLSPFCVYIFVQNTQNRYFFLKTVKISVRTSKCCEQFPHFFSKFWVCIEKRSKIVTHRRHLRYRWPEGSPIQRCHYWKLPISYQNIIIEEERQTVWAKIFQATCRIKMHVEAAFANVSKVCAVDGGKGPRGERCKMSCRELCWLSISPHCVVVLHITPHGSGVVCFSVVVLVPTGVVSVFNLIANRIRSHCNCCWQQLRLVPYFFSPLHLRLLGVSTRIHNEQ